MACCHTHGRGSGAELDTEFVRVLYDLEKTCRAIRVSTLPAIPLTISTAYLAAGGSP